MMTPDDHHGWEASAAAWTRSVDEGDVSRNELLDARMLALCGNVAGLAVLDVGCGEGRFCRMLAARGAQCTGLEPTSGLIATAREREPAGTYVQASAEAMPLEDSTFDLVVSYLTLCDIEDYRGALTEMVRVVKPGGRLLIANLHPIGSANVGGWIRGPHKERISWPVQRYMEEWGDWYSWRGITVYNWHRPLQNYMQTLISLGMHLSHFEEPAPSEERARECPRIADERVRPNFVIMAWTKPAL